MCLASIIPTKHLGYNIKSIIEYNLGHRYANDVLIGGRGDQTLGPGGHFFKKKCQTDFFFEFSSN